jgi:NTP pyrophosphatase (non-canonical NTP hydrolase)
VEDLFNSFSAGICVFPQDFNSDINARSSTFFDCGFRAAGEGNTIPLTLNATPMAKRTKGKAEIYQFPLPLDDSIESETSRPPNTGMKEPRSNVESKGVEVAISGTYRKDNQGLMRDFEELQDIGCKILSPVSARVVSEADGFVFMAGESLELPEQIELRHLRAIQESQFVWLHAPDGYVGLSAALEVGFAKAIGIPVYSRAAPTDTILASFVTKVESPRDVIIKKLASGAIPNPAVQAFQKYYKRAALQRGYANESARDTLLLMVEEVGELARAIRKREKITRHGSTIRENEALELADVFIYVVHLANVLGINLSDVVKQKEFINVKKLLQRRTAI